MHPNFIIGGGEFPLVTRTISIAGTDVRVALVPYDPAQLERIASIRGLEERFWPYWLEEWPATYALAEALDKEDSSQWRGPALDLGCGSGFLAAYLRIRFGFRPFSFDFNADACRLAAYNGTLSDASLGTTDPRAPGRDDAAPVEAQASPPVSTPARVFCGDFSAFPSRARFGLVFAGEMLYTRDNQQPILDFLTRHLTPDGKAFLADPGRSAASGFAAAADRSGFRVDIGEAGAHGGDRNVQVYRLSRRQRE